MEKIPFTKNENVLGIYFVTEEKEYSPEELVPVSKIENGVAIFAFQANYLKYGESI